MKRFGLLGLLLLGVFAGRASADPITLTWDANPASDHVLGYVVYIGTESGDYTQRIDVGDAVWYIFPDAVAGQAYYFAVVAYSEGPVFGWLSGEAYGWSNAPPFLTNPGDRTDIVGTALTPLQLQAFDPYGEPVSYSVNGLPPGLTLQGSTGLITGTGTDVGVYSVDATALDPSVPPLTDTKTFTWTIAPPPPIITLTPDPASVGTAVTTTVTNDPANATDWAGWFLEGADDKAFLDWCYLNGTKTPPSTGLASASVSCFTPTAPGRYQVRLFVSNSFARDGVSNTITVQAPAISLTPNPVMSGATVTATVTAPGKPKDWIGLFPEGAADTAFVAWCYLNGSKTAPLVGLVNATTTCLMPTPPGRFQARLFSNDTFTRLATSDTLTVLSHPALSISGVTAAEGQSGTTDFVFVVSMAPANAAPVTVQYATADRTAIAGSDYIATTGSITFAPGVTSQTITVAVDGDSVFEPSETFAVVLSNSSDANTSIAVAEAVATIVNDDASPGPSLVVTPDQGSVGDPETVTVSQAPGSTTDWVGVFPEGAVDTGFVGWCYLNGAKTPPATAIINGPVSCFTPTTPGRFQARLFANNSFTRVATSNTITLAPHPTLSIGSVTVAEGQSGTTDFVFTVSVTFAYSLPVTVQYATADRTAAAGTDYIATSGSLTFAPGVTAQTITVAVDGDTTYEPAETFAVLLSNPTNATITVAEGVGTIVNDDPAALGAGVALAPDPAAVGSVLTATVTMAAGNTTDWVGLFSEGANDTSYVGWCYLNGTKTPPGAALITSDVQCFTPTLSGRYQVRLFANNGFTRLATSNTITVSGSSISLSPDPASTGATLTAVIVNAPGNATDWIGLYREGAGDTSFSDWCYLNGTKTKPASGTASASVSCFTPMSSGRYQVRLFSNNTFAKVTTSNTITVP